MKISFIRLFVHAIALALIADFFLGIGYANAMNIPLSKGVYCTYMTSVTIGGDVNPHGWGAHLLLAGAGAIPLFCFSAAVAFAINFLGSIRLDLAEKRMVQRLHEHHEEFFKAQQAAHKELLDQIKAAQKGGVHDKPGSEADNSVPHGRDGGEVHHGA